MSQSQYSLLYEIKKSTISLFSIPALIIRDQKGRIIGRKASFIPLPGAVLEASLGGGGFTRRWSLTI